MMLLDEQYAQTGACQQRRAGQASDPGAGDDGVVTVGRSLAERWEWPRHSRPSGARGRQIDEDANALSHGADVQPHLFGDQRESGGADLAMQILQLVLVRFEESR
jgi:hypothetical protein